MQETRYDDGRFERKFFVERDEEALKEKLHAEHLAAMQAGAIEIKQALIDPNQLCPCGSGRRTKNCCIKRLLRKRAKGEAK